MAGLIAPERLEALIAAAEIAVEFVPDGAFLVESLMIFFGWVEGGGGGDLRRDRLVKKARFLEDRFRLLRQALLLLVVVKDFAPVLIPRIAKLPVDGERVDIVPENLQQLLITDLSGVVSDLHRLGVSRSSGRNVLVSRVLHPSAGVAGGDGEHPL